jgi:phage terminase small subunit
MPQPRKPTAILDAEGAFIRHPERSRESEPETSDKKPLGDAPAYLSEFQKEVWAQLSAQMLPGVCFESDRTSFELLVRLVCKMRTDTINRSEVSSLIALTGRFAMNPADRSKVAVEKPKESKLDKFLRRSAPANSIQQPTSELPN